MSGGHHCLSMPSPLSSTVAAYYILCRWRTGILACQCRLPMPLAFPVRATNQRAQIMRKTRRHLPHIETDGATYFITFTLREGVTVDLTTPPVAAIITGALCYFAGSRYLLYDYTIMPDHAHAIIKPLTEESGRNSLRKIMHSIKSWTATRINECVGHTGHLWQDESWDRIIRGRADYEETAHYIWNNPMERGLVDDPAKWPWWGRGGNDEVEDNERHGPTANALLNGIDRQGCLSSKQRETNDK